MMKRNSRWLALAALVCLLLACFMPWTWHADLGKSFNGFYSERNIYGKPAKFLLMMASATALLAFIKTVWAMRSALFFAAVNLAYAVKTYIVFTTCYLGYCPEKKPGVFLMLASVSLLMLSALFPSGTYRSATSAPAADSENASA